MQTDALLQNVSIVLVNTKTPGNIGAIARCMMNTGLSRLILIRPPRVGADEAKKFAAGAEVVLDQAVIVPTLRDAIAGHNLIIGASRRSGKYRKSIRLPREMAESVVRLLPNNKVAVVFGREVNGLDREHLSLCHELVSIPSAEAFPSLNLSHAVMIIAYELYIAATLPASPGDGRELAPAKELESFYGHLREALSDIGFLGMENREHMMFTLRQIFGRCRLDSRELSILRGILTRMEKPVKTGR